MSWWQNQAFSQAKQTDPWGTSNAVTHHVDVPMCFFAVGTEETKPSKTWKEKLLGFHILGWKISRRLGFHPQKMPRILSEFFCWPSKASKAWMFCWTERDTGILYDSSGGRLRCRGYMHWTHSANPDASNHCDGKNQPRIPSKCAWKRRKKRGALKTWDERVTNHSYFSHPNVKNLENLCFWRELLQLEGSQMR